LWKTSGIAKIGRDLRKGAIVDEVRLNESGQRPRVTAVILDQYSLWLDTVKRLTERAGIKVVAATTSPQSAKEALTARAPSVFVLGFERRSMEMSLVNELLDVARSVRGLTTLVVSNDDDPEFVEQCLRSGVYAYILKTVRPEDLSRAIRQAVNRSVYLFARPSRNSVGSRASAPRLTSRELEVLRLAAEGLPNAQVAKRLWISEPTVKYHLSRTYEKLGVSNRTGAARWAERHGLLDPVTN
jgi:DNA-binding NarL/FixJ family response regulator